MNNKNAAIVSVDEQVIRNLLRHAEEGEIMITKEGFDFHFVFDPQQDDPAEGTTLTGIWEGRQNIAPSKYEGEIPWDLANFILIRDV